MMCQAVMESVGNDLEHYTSTGFPQSSISGTCTTFPELLCFCV